MTSQITEPLKANKESYLIRNKMEKNQLIISPKTKVLELIETYPQLEEVLISYVPAFVKLRNPILRKTVAKITSLQQAAAIGNVKTEDLINRLRQEVGQNTESIAVSSSCNRQKPAWLNTQVALPGLDASELLARGEHPVNQVIADLRKLSKDQVYCLQAPFLPAPLIDKASSLGFNHFIEEDFGQQFKVYFFMAAL